MVVSRLDLERTLASLRAKVPEPSNGLWGPSTMSWRINRESALFLGGGRAALLQLAHPFVAHAIDQHSRMPTDPVGRFLRTFDAVFRMLFGDLDEAIASARRVHTIHTRIRGVLPGAIGRLGPGTRYAANDTKAIIWVFATLVDSAVQAYELFVEPLGDDEKARYYEESRRFANLFGIPDDALPADWAEFRDYWDRTLDSDTIVVAAPARAMAEVLFSPPVPLRPLAVWGKTLTAGLLPDELRQEYGLPFGKLERAVCNASIVAIKQSYRHLPSRLRFMEGYVLAERRLAGKPGPDWLGKVFEKTRAAIEGHGRRAS